MFRLFCAKYCLRFCQVLFTIAEKCFIVQSYHSLQIIPNCMIDFISTVRLAVNVTIKLYVSLRRRGLPDQKFMLENSDICNFKNINSQIFILHKELLSIICIVHVRGN